MRVRKLYTNTNKHFAEIKYFTSVYNSYTLHSHSHLCLCIIEEGSIKIKYKNNEEYIKNEKQMFIFNPNQVHKTENINGKGYYILFLNFSWCEYIQKSLFREKRNLSHSINIHKKINDRFLNLCKDIISKDTKENKEELLCSFVKHLYQKYSIPININTKTDNIVRVVDKYINSNIDFKLTTNDISLHLGYDKSYFIRKFKKDVGITPNNYILNKKIEAVKKHLENKDSSKIASVAQDLGFYDQSHLNRNFKKIYAISPNKYKN